MKPTEFTHLINPIRDKLFRFAQRMLKDPAGAKDVVQDVCIKLWQQRNRLDEIDNLEAWSMRLVRNRCLDLLRSPSSRMGGLDEKPEESDPHPSPGDLTEQTDMMRHLRQLMQKLPQKQRLVMHLRDLEGLSYQEIADTLDMTMAQVKVNIFRARTRIRTELEKTNAYGLR